MDEVTDKNTPHHIIQLHTKVEAINIKLDDIKTCNMNLNNRIDNLLLHPKDGMVVRLDRLEQNEESRHWWMKTAVGAAIASVVTSVWAHIKLLK